MKDIASTNVCKTEASDWTSFSETRRRPELQDLPMEIVELILVLVVAMEVMGATRAKSVWKQSADMP